jgi:peptidoglycan/xylan/chitin deacetylase (PgdA/CDA1 family)
MKTNTKLMIVIVALLTVINSVNAQTNSAPVTSSIPIEMLFPQGKSKALILSFDDGNVADKQLVKLMNEYALVGTFHLNSNKLGTKDYLTKDETRIYLLYLKLM